MNSRTDSEYLRRLSKDLFWIGIVTLLVGIKLTLSFFVPGLKTQGELMLSGGLLLIYTFRIFGLRRELVRRVDSSSP
jgi:hypothetical protein